MTVVLLASTLPSQPGPLWRAFGALLTLGLGWSPLRTLVFARGTHVHRVEWRSDGSWWISDGEHNHEARLHSSSAAFGPWILLAWRRRMHFTRSHALVDAGCVGEATFRALRGRLRLEAVSGERRRVDENR